MPHYRAHVQAVHKHLPDELRGRVTDIPQKYQPDDIVLVAGFADIGALPPDQRVVYVEHGAGQAYVNTKHPQYYHGSLHPENVIGYICPRRAVAEVWGRPAFAAGAPVCDPYPLATENETPVLVWTHHWDAHQVSPEARSALSHYGDALASIVSYVRSQGLQFVGHGHPRHPLLRPIWQHLGVEYKPIDWVREHCDILVCDNSSLMYEMAYLCRQVVGLNAPWYRRDIEHGLRFWDWKGPLMESPLDVLDFDFKGALKSAELRGASHQNAKAAYDRPFSDGSDGRRAASWLVARFA